MKLRKLLPLLWLIVPIACAAWFYGPGRDQLRRQDAGLHIRQAVLAEEDGKWSLAAAAYRRAAAALPTDAEGERQRLALAEARAAIRLGELIAGQEQLQQLVDDVDREGACASDVALGARHELATASYFAAWLMRLEGATAEEWKPEAERARQQFRLLAERAGENPQTEQFAANLEATIRLEQMDLSELMARPLPKNCPNNCRNLSQRKRKQCQSRSQQQQEGEGKEKEEQDARRQIKEEQRGAGLNQRQDSGS